MSSKNKDNDGRNSIKDIQGGHTNTSVVELLDVLISHMNTKELSLR
jgi:hypothetical protein